MVLSKNIKAQAWFPLDDVRMYRRYEVVWCGELSSEVSRSATDALTQKIRATRREEHQQGWSKRDRDCVHQLHLAKVAKVEAEGCCRWEGKGKDLEIKNPVARECFNHVQKMSWVWLQLAQFMSCQSETVSPKLSFQGYVRCIQRQMTVKLLRHRNTWLQQLSIIRIYTVARTSRHAQQHSSSGQKLPVGSITISHIFYKWSKTGLTSALHCAQFTSLNPIYNLAYDCLIPLDWIAGHLEPQISLNGVSIGYRRK